MQQNWKELADLTGYEVEKLYQSVRQEALRELAFQELAVTRILKDLIEIRKHSPDMPIFSPTPPDYPFQVMKSSATGTGSPNKEFIPS